MTGGDPGKVIQDRRKVPLGWDEAADLDKHPGVVPDPAEVEVPENLRITIEAAVNRYPEKRSATLPALAAAQRVHGWCSPTAMRQVAAVLQVTPAYLASVATFYDMLRTEPLPGQTGDGPGPAANGELALDPYIYVCTSVACHLRDAQTVYDAIATEARDQRLEGIELREFECLGACDMAPMASVGGRYVGPLDVSDAPALVAAVKAGRKPLPGRGLGDDASDLPPPTDHPDRDGDG